MIVKLMFLVNKYVYIGKYSISTIQIFIKVNLVHFSFIILGVQLCFRRFPIDGFSGKWWSK